MTVAELITVLRKYEEVEPTDSAEEPLVRFIAHLDKADNETVSFLIEAVEYNPLTNTIYLSQ
jgi:hypothetical protein